MRQNEALFYVHRIHYSDHPGKNNTEWKQKAALGMSAARWEQEQEISFASVSDLVYPEFDCNKHILRSEYAVNPEWEIYRTIDFGYHHPCVLWIQKTPEGDLIVFDEWVEPNRTTDEMLIAIRNRDLVNGISESDVTWTACDPAGDAVQDSGISAADTLRNAGMKLRHRPSRIAPGIERVKAALADATGKTRLRISPRCEGLIADFARYRWADRGEEPLKDGVSDHTMDAVRYFLINLESADEALYTPRVIGSSR